MRNYLFSTIICLLLFSCSDDDSTPQNTAPTIPTLVAPTNNKLCISNTVTFQWNKSTDAENNAITYQILISKDQSFTTIAKTEESTTTSKSITLEKGILYYWKVKATDDQGFSSEFSTVYSFYTSGDAVLNYVPFAPELVLPAFDAALNTSTVTLKWEAEDLNTTDKLVYDVYFGTDNPPTAKVSENIETKTLDRSILPTKEYYWKIVVKDNKGGETIGQIWKFKTN